MTVEDPGRRGVDQRRLDSAPEQRFRLGDEELVEPILARDQHREPARPASGPTPLLAERRDGAREADRDGTVERADVDPELEGVGGGHAEQLAVDEPALDGAALLRGIRPGTGRVGGPSPRRRGRSRSDARARQPCGSW